MSVGKLQIFFSQFYSSPWKSGSQVGDFHESNVFGPFKDLYALAKNIKCYRSAEVGRGILLFFYFIFS